MKGESLKSLNNKITQCHLCPRLVRWRENISESKRTAFKNEEYWARPVPSFGDKHARLLIVGLAPSAHGANRTGRMFTGDRSGEWLYKALHRAGFASQSVSLSAKDSQTLTDAYITAIIRCAPPQNKPTSEERRKCIEYFTKELLLLKSLYIILALGQFAWDGTIMALTLMGHKTKPKPLFSHAAETKIGPFFLLGSFHPSQQNTFTGKLTQTMFDKIFERIRILLCK